MTRSRYKKLPPQVFASPKKSKRTRSVGADDVSDRSLASEAAEAAEAGGGASVQEGVPSAAVGPPRCLPSATSAA
jgi:hypothetical protein